MNATLRTLNLGTKPNQSMQRWSLMSQLLSIPPRLLREGGAFSARKLSSCILVKDTETTELLKENVTIVVSKRFADDPVYLFAP